MPLDKSTTCPNKPWQARVSINRQQHSLGMYATYKEALAVEDAFRSDFGRIARPTPAQLTKRNTAIVKMHKKGATYGEIASVHGISKGRVYRIVKEMTDAH